MKIVKNKTMAISDCSILNTFNGSFNDVSYQMQVHTHLPWQIPTYSFISVSPNPIGVGQTVNVNFWVNHTTTNSECTVR